MVFSHKYAIMSR